MSLILFFLAQATSRRIAEESDVAKLKLSSDTLDTNVILDDSTAIELIMNDSIYKGMWDTSGTKREIRKLERQSRFSHSLVKAISDENLFIKSFYKNISYALFILMPAFALILRLLYIRRKRYYIEHLVFALNMHSFALLVFSVLIVLKMVFPSGRELFNILLVLLPVYLGSGMKRFYGQAWFKTITKELVLSLVYTILLVITLLILLFITLLML